MREVHLSGPKRPPTWLNKLTLNVGFVWRITIASSFTTIKRSASCQDLAGARRTSDVPTAARDGLQPWGQWDWPLTLSAPERAVLELLDELPDHESFHQVDKLMEGLTNLSPRRLQKLLADCRSVKVKRLFFFFADRHQHAWLKRLDKSAIDLGKGKRMLVKGGKLDPPTRSPCRRIWMAFAEIYRRQVALLIRTLPLVAEEKDVSRSRAAPPSICSSATCRGCRSIST